MEIVDKNVVTLSYLPGDQVRLHFTTAGDLAEQHFEAAFLESLLDRYRISSNKTLGAYLFSGFLDWGLIRKRGLLEAGGSLNFFVFH